jgi:hypothetical protein
VTTAPSATATDPLANLPAATADAVRAELRAGERVAYAGVPMTMYDAGDLRARMVCFLMPLGLVLMIGCTIGLIASLNFDWETHSQFLVLSGGLLFSEVMMANDWFTMRNARRKAARSACVVTDQRVILLATSPSRSVLSIEARDIAEVFCWIVSPKCGHVRFQGGVQSTEANSLMYVPNPRACEAAMAALRDSSRSAGALQTAG